MRKFKRIFTMLLVAGLLALMMTPAWAATSAEKQAAIDAGLAYLANTQNSDGSWTASYGGGGAFNQADTGAALLAFVDQKYKPLGWNGQDYSTVVTNATNYLLKNASTLSFNGGNWWGFGNNSSGLRWGAGTGEDTYISGIVIPALSRLVSNPYNVASPLVSPSTVISGTGNGSVDGKTYAQVIQGAVDSFTFYQSGPSQGNQYGGWHYFAGNPGSDMSTTQWAPISYLFAQQVPGVTVPAPGGATRTALQAYLTASQYTNVTWPGNAGGVDYQPGSYYIVNNTHAGGFLVSNKFAGGGGSVADAIAWLNSHWKDGPSGTWWGNEGNPYAMWAVYKGLETWYGTTGAGPISNLNTQGSNSIDAGATWNWWEDYSQYLVDTQNHGLIQNGGGSWPGYGYWYGPMVTAWDINILNATATVQPPTGAPEPATMLLLGLGLLGLAGIRRRFK